MERKQKRQNQNGYMMIEVLICLFIVGIIFVLYDAAIKSVLLTSNVNHQEIAMRIANSQLEALRNTPYASLPGSGSFGNSLLSSLPSGQASITVSDYNPKTKKITATVSWYETGSQNTRSVSLTTLITQVGGLP